MKLANFRRQAGEWRRATRHRAARAKTAPSLPALPARLEPLAGALELDGVAMSSLEELGAPSQLLPELDRLLAATVAPADDYVVHASDEAIAQCESVLRWGLGEDLIALCSRYIGLPVAYRGVSIRRDVADGRMAGTRFWHRDGEDQRILKLIVYVNDVDESTGPFECVPRRHSPPTWRVDLFDGNRVDEAQFDRLVAPQQRRACTGRRGSVVIVDTCAVYHRGRVPTAKDRLTAFYCYNSVSPLRPEYCQPMFDRGAFSARHKLSPLQQAALDYRY